MLHSWDLTPREAVAVQRRLARRVRLRPLPARIATIAGADVAFSGRTGRFSAAVVVMSFPGLAVLERVTAAGTTRWPYLPGLFSFRELPPLLEAFARLSLCPDVLLFDGQGIAHPRRCGLASHAGLLLGVPSVGCAKSRLVGEYREPGSRRGARARLVDRGETVGAVVRTREGVRPLYVSPGHLADLASAVALVLATARRFRIPEPLREAHRAAGIIN